jgi:N-acetylglucosamine kinase-like BadF-type ATPase
MSRYVIGVDGGGTRTGAVLLEVDAADPRQAKELARTEGRSAVADATEPGRAASAVADVCRDVTRLAGVEPPVDVVWAGLAGAGREAARSAVELELGRAGVARVARVGTDVLAAFQDAFGDGPGVLLVAGTGSIAWGRAEDGREGRVGGWGHHIGDEGSGYAIGVEALRRVARDADGRGPATNLRTIILTHLGLDVVDDLVPWSATVPRAQVAALALLVVAAAAGGDAAAREILDHAVEELERHVLAILENLGPWASAPTVALAGGLLRPGRAVRSSLEAALARDRVRLLDRELDPAMGAGRLACAVAI